VIGTGHSLFRGWGSVGEGRRVGDIGVLRGGATSTTKILLCRSPLL